MLAREKQKAAYEKQIAEKVDLSYVYGYEDPTGRKKIEIIL